MSIHPSLRAADKNKKQRSVLKRTERLKIMAEKGEWKEDEDVFGLPKIKTLRIKIKKEKAAEKVEGAAEGAAPAGTEAAKTKEQAPTKAAPKAQEKK